MNNLAFLPQERRAVLGVTALFALRMAGLFLLYPVLSFYAESLPGQTPVLMGLAFGIYGLAQLGLQIPFGMLSDRFGRKPLIAIGLIIFALGCVVAAFSHHIYGLILGRFLQGAGAISSVCTAALGDLVEAPRRSKAMAILGVSIGASFCLSLILGPSLSEAFGVPGLFLWIAGACGLGLFILFFIPPIPVLQTQPSMKGLQNLMENTQVMRIAIGVGVLHALLTAMFMIVPGQLQTLTGTSLTSHGYFYAVGVLLVFLTVFPLLRVIEKNHWQSISLLIAWFVLCVSQVLMGLLPDQVWVFFFALILFFLAFNLLEATLPAAMSHVAPIPYRGAAMGIYSTFQFGGTFIGGVLGGVLLQYVSTSIFFFVQAGIILLWLMLIINKK